MNKDHVILCVIAESSAGKDTLVNKLCENMGYNQIISYTTRSRRENEGDTHIFVDDTIYHEMLEANQVAAYTEINGYRYWSTIEQLYINDIYIIDPSGVEVLKSLNLPNLRIVSVYINVPEDIRKERAKSRGDDMNVYRARCLSERQQFRDMKKDMAIDYVVSNIDFSKAFAILKRITTIEGLLLNHKEDITK